MLKIHDNIRKYRKNAGMTQDELARLAGYSDRSSIAKIERGLVDLSQSRIKQFADIFGVTPSTLMGWEKEPEDLAELTATILQDTDLMAMIEKYLTLSAADQKAVRAMVDALAAKGDSL